MHEYIFSIIFKNLKPKLPKVILMNKYDFFELNKGGKNNCDFWQRKNPFIFHFIFEGDIENQEKLDLL